MSGAWPCSAVPTSSATPSKQPPKAMRIDEDIRLACADPPWVASTASYFSANAHASPYIRGVLTDPYFRVPQQPPPT